MQLLRPAGAIGLQWAVFASVAVFSTANAKLIDVTLSELVQESSFIAYGHSGANGNVSSDESGGAVAFEPITVLKGTPGIDKKTVSICNSANDAESYDLRKLAGYYIVFGVQSGSCCKPVHGISSIVVVKDNVARTSAIVDQPETQPLTEILTRLRALVAEKRNK